MSLVANNRRKWFVLITWKFICLKCELYLFEIYNLLILIVILKLNYFQMRKMVDLWARHHAGERGAGLLLHPCRTGIPSHTSHTTSLIFFFILHWNSYASWQGSGYDCRSRFLKTEYFFDTAPVFFWSNNYHLDLQEALLSYKRSVQPFR